MLLSCAQSDDRVVSWRPDQPKSGDKIVITFSPDRLVQQNASDLSVFMVYQFVRNDEVKTFRVPMKSSRENWRGAIKTEPGTILLRLKFEDNLDRAEDNKGLGWNIILDDAIGNTPRGAHLQLGLIHSKLTQPGAILDYNRAVTEFQTELKLYPDNYQAWLHLWETQIRKSGNSQSSVKATAAQLDSLLANSPESSDLKFLAFQTCWKLLNDPQAAIQIGESLLANFGDDQNAEEVRYALIFFKNENNPAQLDADLLSYANQTKNSSYQKKIYYRLGNSFRERQELGRAIEALERYLELAPNDIHARLDLANIYLKNQNYAIAQRFIDEANANCSEANYLNTMPWNDPEQRRAFFNLDRCRIFSTYAALETAQSNFSQALQHRKQVIEIGTKFPAFEWAKIGDIYFHSGKLDSAESAYIKAIAINPAQFDEIMKLQNIYLQRGGKADGFTIYLRDAVSAEMRASAKTAPDFELMDLDGNLLRLSDQRRKVIVLTFWDSWSSASLEELPQLNALASSFGNNPDVLFWAISVEAPVSIKKFVTDHPFQFHHFHSGYPAKQQYNIIGFPTHLVIDQQRKIRYSHVGFISDIQNQLEQEIKQLLDESKQIS